VKGFDKFMQLLLADQPSVALVAFSKGFARHEEARRKKDYRAATRHLHEAIRYVPEHLQSKTLAEMIKSVDDPVEGRNVAAVMSRITPTLQPKLVAEILGALIIDNIDQRHQLRVAKYIA
jgi:hypothetical protein